MAEVDIMPPSVDNERLAQLQKQAEELFGKTMEQQSRDIREKDIVNYQQSQEDNALARTPNNISATPRTQQVLGGDAISGPNPGGKNLDNSQQHLASLTNALDNIENVSKDPTAFAKPFSYNAGKYNVDFDRYYSHPKFKKLGWSPFRDNEDFYNQNSSWSDDFSRMRSKYLALAGQGLGWGDFNTDADTESARNFEKNMSIANSSKEGFGASFTNFLGNSGWTVGIISQMAAEELALLGITAGAAALSVPTAGATAPVAGAAGATAIARGAMGIRRLMQGFDLAKNLGKSVRATFKEVNSADKARTAWNTAKATGGKAADFLNPFSRTTQFASDLAKGAKGTSALGNMALLTRGVGSFYRDIREINLVLNESELEGGSVQNQITDELISDYYKKNNKSPEGQDAERIFNAAKEAGAKTTLLNIPAIYLSNKIVLGTALRGFKPSSLVRAEMGHGLSGSLVFNQAWKKLGQDPWSVLKGRAKYFNSNYWKQAPSKLILGSLRYGKANFAEGTQELMQEVVSAGAKDYYSKIYKDPGLAGNRQFMASFNQGVEDQMTGQGLEVFLSGFFMGGLIQGPQNLLFNRVSKTWTKYTDPAEFTKIKADREEYTNRVVNTLNDVTKNTGKYASAIEENMITQQSLVKTMSEAADNNDRKQYEDGRDESMFSHVYQLLRGGNYDYFVDQLESMKDLTPEELGEAFSTKDPNGDDHNGPIANRLSSVVNRAKQIKNLYDKINTRFQNPYDPSIYSRKDNPTEYALTVDAQNAYEQMKMNIVFGDYAFSRASERMATILEDISGKDKPLSKASASDITVLFDPFLRASEMKTLTGEIKAYSDGTPEQKKLAKKAERKREALLNLSEEMSAYETLIDTQRKTPRLTDKESKAIRTEEVGSEVINRLRDAYLGYIKVLGKDNNEIVIDSNINKSFNGLLDYVELDQDAKAFGRYINFISDPQNAFEHAKRMQGINQELRKQYVTNMDQALKEYMRRSDNNDLFNALLKVGVFIHPDDMENLEVNKILPNIFINVAPPHDQVPLTSDKYKNDILPILRNYAIITDSVPPVEPIPVVAEVVIPVADTPKESATPGIIVYATLGAGKSTLAQTKPEKYVDGDEILFKHLKTLAEEYNESGNEVVKIPDSAQDAGSAFFNFYKTQTPDDKKTIVDEIQQIFKDIAATGKTVLTSNWFAKDIADRVYLRKDIESVMEELRKRGKTNVKTEAQKIIDRESSRFEKRKQERGDIQEIPAGMTIQDMLEGGKPSVKEGYTSMLDKIGKLDTMDSIKAFEDNIIDKMKEDEDYLERYGFNGSDITQLLNNRREEISKTVTFATVSKGNYILMKDGSLVHVRAKRKDKTLTVMRQGDAKTSQMTGAELEKADRIVTKENMKQAPEMTTEDKAAADQNMKNTKEFLADPNARKNATEEAKNKSKGDSDKDLLNSICT